MQRTTRSAGKAIVLIVLAGLAIAAPSMAATRKVLHAFTGNPDGLAPESNLIMDAHGNLYGTTYAGGTGPCEYGCGTVFELSPNSTGGYTERILHSFQGPLVDGQQPMAPLIFDAQGNLYGTTLSGGQNVTAASGTVFKLAPNADGTWTETVLHSFNGGLAGGTDGGEPQAGLVFDTAGNLYGTTAGGGTGSGCAGGNGCGTVFELTPSASGGWGETILHNFTNDHRDGWSPYAKLIMDRSGNLYGTTFVGGAAGGGGTVFRLTRAGDGWEESFLYSFSCGADGCSPYSSLVFDTAGDLYGTTVGGGDKSGDGVVYKLSRNAAGDWVQTVLYAFKGASDGSYAYGNPILDASGNVYGTTLDGGGDSNTCSAGCGIVYRLAPGTGGGFTESVLARFGNGEAGSGPLTGLLMDSSGNLYGTAAFSGPHGDGVVFEIVR
ncbi:MAG: choice-of-anchor tandem repeat GloVer-containing protein [Bryobacteraceae bacterium]